MSTTNFLLTLLTTILLVVMQTSLKFWLNSISIKDVNFSLVYLKTLITLPIMIAFTSFFISGGIWLYLLKKIEFSLLYPFISLSYIFGAFAAMYFFNESIPITRWIGMIIIIFGVYLVSIK